MYSRSHIQIPLTFIPFRQPTTKAKPVLTIQSPQYYKLYVFKYLLVQLQPGRICNQEVKYPLSALLYFHTIIKPPFRQLYISVDLQITEPNPQKLAILEWLFTRTHKQSLTAITTPSKYRAFTFSIEEEILFLPQPLFISHIPFLLLQNKTK